MDDDSVPKIRRYDPARLIANSLASLVDHTRKRQRWMMFVDGENFTIRANPLIEKSGAKLPRDVYKRDVFLWTPGLMPDIRKTYQLKHSIHYDFLREPERSYYYTSLKGEDSEILAVRLALRRQGFTPLVFKKIRKETKAKGVDIALTKDMLMEAVRDHYDVAILITGDGDYVPVVEEVQRLGKVVIVAFWDGEWVSEELRWRADHFLDLTDELDTALKNCINHKWSD